MCKCTGTFSGLQVLLMTAVSLAIKQLSGFRCGRGLRTRPNLLLIDLYSLQHLRDVFKTLNLTFVGFYFTLVLYIKNLLHI